MSLVSCSYKPPGLGREVEGVGVCASFENKSLNERLKTLHSNFLTTWSSAIPWQSLSYGSTGYTNKVVDKTKASLLYSFSYFIANSRQWL